MTDWKGFFREKRSRYIGQWVTYARQHTHDHDRLETEVANLISSAEQANEAGDSQNLLALVGLLCTGDQAFMDLRGYMRDSVRLLQWAVDAAGAVGDKREQGRLLGNLGLCLWALDKYGDAIDCYEKALTLAREVGDRQTEGRHLGSLGLAWATLMDTPLAIRYYEAALAIAREVGDRQAEQSHLGCLGLVWAEEGMAKMGQAPHKEKVAPYFRRAIQYYEQALTIAEEIGDRRGEGSQLGNLGNAWRYLGEEAKAIKFLKQALTKLREIGDRRNEGFHLANLGNAYQALGELTKAKQYWQEALLVFDTYGDSRAEALRTSLKAVNGTNRTEPNPIYEEGKTNGEETFSRAQQGTRTAGYR